MTSCLPMLNHTFIAYSNVTCRNHGTMVANSQSQINIFTTFTRVLTSYSLQAHWLPSDINRMWKIRPLSRHTCLTDRQSEVRSSEQRSLTRSPASAGIANRPLVSSFATRTTLSSHNIEYLCLNLFSKFRFSILREFWRQANTVLPLLGGDAPRLGWWNLASR